MAAGTRSWIYFSLMNIIVVAAAWFAADRIGLLWMVPIMLSINVLILTYGQVLEFSHLEAHPVQGFDRWGLTQLVSELSKKLEIHPPQILLLPTLTPQALTFSRGPKSARIYVSEGLLEQLERPELFAVVSQQLVTLQLRAGVGFYLLGAMTDLLYRMGRLVDLAFSWIFGWRAQFSAWALTPMIWLLQRLFLPRQIYFEIDKKTASFLPDPSALARAIWKLESYSKTRPLQENSLVWSHMCSVSPLLEKRPLIWIKTQPTMKSRIKNLTGHFPI